MALQNVEANITLDLYNHDTTPATVKAIQLDSETRYVAARLQNVGVQYDVDSGATVQLIVVRPDKVGVQITGTTFTYGDEGAQFLGTYAELTQVALAVSGKMRGQFKITSGDQILRTEIFAINNGEALDASTDEWAGEYDGYDLAEMAASIETNTDDIAALEADVEQIKEDLSEYEGIFTADVDESVQNWLDDHPEATTTVQDGSLVKAKFSAELQKETLKDYAHYIYSEADFESIGANNASWILAQDITITQPIDSFSGNKFFDLNGHKITLANDYDAEYIFALGSNITLANESKTARAIFNGTIDCNDIDCSVFHVDICWRLSLTDVIILNNVRGLFTYTDTATYGARGAENVLKNVAIYHSIGDSTARCGLQILMGDSLFFGVFPVGFQTGVQVNGVNNLLIGVHPWGYPRQDTNPYSESLIMYIGFKIMTAKHMLIGCCADTFEPIDTSSDVSYENGGIGFYCCASYCVLTSCKTIVHSNSNSNKHVSFYFSDVNPNTGLNKYLYGCSLADPRIDLNNDKTPYKQTPLYLQVPKVYVMRTNFPLYDGSNVLHAAITMAEGFSLASRSFLHRDGLHIRGRLIVVKDSGIITSSQTSVLTFNNGFKPTATYDGGCFLGVGEWDVKAVGYFYMSQTDVKIADKNASATYTAAFIDLDYTIDFA